MNGSQWKVQAFSLATTLGITYVLCAIFDWKVIVTHMRVRAGLTGQDARDILTFLQGSN